MGVLIRRTTRRGSLGVTLPCVLAFAASAAALAIVAFPIGASAAPGVPPTACPPDVSLQGIERAPGGVILSGTVIAVTPEVGRVRLAVEAWYHRGMIPGLATGEHPARIDVTLGPRRLGPGDAAVAELPAVGARLIVAGTWDGPPRGVSVACGVLADVTSPAGAAWQRQASAHYGAVIPATQGGPPQVPLDAPWFLLGIGATLMLLGAMALGAIAEAFDPAPAV